MKIFADAAHQIYPSIPARIKASEIDGLVIFGFLLVLFGAYIAIGWETPSIIFIGIAVVVLYEPVLVTWRGQTIGHKVMGFRVIDSVSHTNLSFSRSLSRFVLKVVFGVVSLIWAFFEDRQQFFHDRMTRSLAVMSGVPEDRLRIQPVPSVVTVNSAAMPPLFRRIAFIVLYTISASVLLSRIVGTLFPSCVAETPENVEQCYIIESITGGILLVLLACIIVAGLRGGLPGARKFSETT